MILALNTSSSQTEIFLFDTQGKMINSKKFDYGRELAEKLLVEISAILSDDFQQLAGLIVYRGPGSFTGLRIGITVMNTIADSEKIAIVGVTGGNWLEKGLTKLQKNANDKIVIPEYGRPARITSPRK